MATPPSSQATIVSVPSSWKIHLEESTHDLVTNRILHCIDPERLDPVSESGINSHFIQSSQIGCLSSQHCPVKLNFPLSSIKRSEEFGCTLQSSEPFTFETVPVGDRETDESRVSFSKQMAPASVSVTNQMAPASVSVSKQMASARASVSDQLVPARVPVSLHRPAACIKTGPDLQMFTSRSDMHLSPATLTSLSPLCISTFQPVSLSCTTTSASVSIASTRTSLTGNQAQGKSKASHQPDLAICASAEVPRVSELGCAGTYPCVTSKPTELESEETEMDSFDGLVKSAKLTKLVTDLGPPAHSVADRVTDSAHKLQLTSVSVHRKATNKNGEVIMSDEKQKSGERKNQKSSNRAKGSKRLLSQRRDPMVLFAKRNLRNRPDNCKRKLFNIDQMLEAVSSGSQTDDDNTRFGRSEKQQKTLHSASDAKRLKGDSCMPSGRKSKETGTGEKVDAIAKVMLEPLSNDEHFGNTNMVTNRISEQKMLWHEVVTEPDRSSKEQIKKSKMGTTGVPTFGGEELSKAVGFKCIQHDRPELQHINRVAVQDTARDGDRATVGVNDVQTVPSEVTFAEGERERNSKTGAMQSNSDSTCRYSGGHGRNVATDKLLCPWQSLHSRNCWSFIDTYTGATKKSNNQETLEDTRNPQFTFHGVLGGTGSHDKSDTWSYDRDIGTCIDIDAFSVSRDSSARHNSRSVLRRTVSNSDVVRVENKDTERDTTSHNRETVEKYRFCVGPKCRSTSMFKGSSKSANSQVSDPKMLIMPTPKNSLPSHQPQKQSVPHNSHILSPVNSKPLSQKFNRDRIKVTV